MSHHCEDEHFEHDHDHDHGHDHGHSHEAPIATSAAQSLYEQIDTPKIKCLNGVGKGATGKELYKYFIKPHEEKYNTEIYLESDADCQLIINIPFVNSCKVHPVVLRTNANSSGYSTPRTIKIFNNFKKSLDFDTLSGESKVDFKTEHPNNVGVHKGEASVTEDSSFVEYHLPRAQFQNCESLTLFIEDNWADDEDELSQLFFLEIRGEITGKLRPENAVPLMTVYESAPNPLDHAKLESEVSDGLNLGK